MQEIRADIGDTVWIAIGTDKLQQAEVILTFERYGTTHYVVEYATHIDPVMTVRDGYTMSDDPDRPIGMWRRNK